MRWLLDTNVVSEGFRIRPNQQVIEWLAASLRSDLAISAITRAELRDGVAMARDDGQRAALSRWLDTEILPAFGDRTLPLTEDILVDWIGISRRLRRMGKAREAVDLLLASTARVHGLTLATRNVRDFADTGIVVYDPWHDQTHRMDQP